MPPPMLSSRQRRFLTWPLLPPKTHRTKTFENRHLTPDTAREPARCEVSKALDRTVLGKDGLSLFQMRSEALLCLGTRGHQMPRDKTLLVSRTIRDVGKSLVRRAHCDSHPLGREMRKCTSGATYT